MAKKHYVIEAKGSEKIENYNITIENCTYIEKNHRVLDKFGKYRKINKENMSFFDWISTILSAVAVILIVIMLGCISQLKDSLSARDVHIDNIISEIGLIFAVMSIKGVRTFIDRVVLGSRIVKKIMLLVWIMLAPFYLAAFFSYIGISPSISNWASIAAIIISILSY